MPLFLTSDLIPVDRDGTPKRFPAEIPVDITIYQAFRENDDEIKTRVPEVVWNCLGTAADDLQRPALARELVFCHLYGRYDLEVMKMHREGFYFRGITPRVPFTLRSASVRPDPSEPVGKFEQPRKILGKSDRELRLAMPAKMADDVCRVADLIGRTTGWTLRKILIRELFGRRFAVEKPLTPDEEPWDL